MSGTIWAVVVAGGTGSRLGLPYNKVFAGLGGCAVLTRTLRALSESRCYDGILLVLNPRDEKAYRELEAREGLKDLVQLTAWGGETRQQSVKNGLDALPDGVELVSVHDAARPFVEKEVIRATIDSAKQFGSGVAATMVKDTIKRVSGERVVETPDRARLRAVQTPQTFKASLLKQAYQWAERNGVSATDDASLVEKMAGDVRLCVTEAGERNIKLTTREDMQMARRMLDQKSEISVGMGYDVHRLVEGRKLILCGVEVPWEKGLLGHSDADVATHALMDAILGAMGEGDIGRWFPDTDPAYEGISSIKLLEKVMAALNERNGRLLHADLTIVCQRPKLMPHIERMRETLAGAMGVQKTRVNIKATTTEGLGFEGEGLGISSQAVATVERFE